ncbi:hypothetical protein [Sediminivirga luteola]|uniref:hypothetical protein n=1 Tax=Sediminivirga luteola TaxID=1774748 RepID=UPI001F56BFA4|nr:hypothetical protein [Sediminivirga luteola]MCI2265517.1 hypothetical protein [Sediminivirga luteola]
MNIWACSKSLLPPTVLVTSPRVNGVILVFYKGATCAISASCVLFLISAFPASANTDGEFEAYFANEDIIVEYPSGEEVSLQRLEEGDGVVNYRGVDSGGREVTAQGILAPVSSRAGAARELNGQEPGDRPVWDGEGLAQDTLSFEAVDYPVTEDLEPTFARVAIAEGSALLVWRDDDAAREVARQGRAKERVEGTSFYDDHGMADAEVAYQVFTSEAEADSVRLLSVPSTTGGSAEEVQSYAANEQPGTASSYRTFAPSAQIVLNGIQSLGCEGYGIHGGDDRGFQLPDGDPVREDSFRTAVHIQAHWDSQRVDVMRGMGETVALEEGRPVDRRTAPLDGIDPHSVQIGGSFAQVQVEHIVGNPFCVAGAITYYATFRLYSNGMVEVNSQHYQVPNHEVAAGRVQATGLSGEWQWVGQSELDSYQCLLGSCGYEWLRGTAGN